MLRYIIGISIISIVIMIIRYLTNGKILKKHQYALWLIVPVCMILFPFLKIGVTVPEALSTIIPVKEEAVTDIVSDNESGIAVYEQQSGQIESDEQITGNQIIYDADTDSYVIKVEKTDSTEEKIPAPESVNWHVLIEGFITNISILLVILFAVYNAGFVFYCRRNSKFIGRDPISGLKIFGINHKGTPFLLLNRIYVDYSADKIAKYNAGNELYLENSNDRFNQYVLCHEACHYRHGDFIWVIVRYLVLAINWYNPVIWIAFVLSGRDCELACDEEVIRLSGEDASVGYAVSLLELVKKKSEMKFGFTMSTGMRGGYKTMKDRIVAIKNPARRSYKTLAMCLVAVIIISTCFVLEPRAAEAEEPYEDDTVSEVYVEDETADDIVYSSPREQDIFFYRNSIAIKGKLRLPEGEGPFKTVIMCSVYSPSNYDDAAQRFNEYGYATIQFEASNSSEFDPSMLSDSSIDGFFVNELVLDLSAVMDSLRYLPDVDRSNVYLFGHSLGGFISAFLGIERQSEIKGIILVDPYLSESQFITYKLNPNVIINDYVNIYYMFSYSVVPVTFVTSVNSTNINDLERVCSATANGSIILVNGDDALGSNCVNSAVDDMITEMNSWTENTQSCK